MTYIMTPSQAKTKTVLEKVHSGILSCEFLTHGELRVTLPPLISSYYDKEVAIISRRGKVTGSYQIKDGEIIKYYYY